LPPLQQDTGFLNQSLSTFRPDPFLFSSRFGLCRTTEILPFLFFFWEQSRDGYLRFNLTCLSSDQAGIGSSNAPASAPPAPPSTLSKRTRLLNFRLLLVRPQDENKARPSAGGRSLHPNPVLHFPFFPSSVPADRYHLVVRLLTCRVFSSNALDAASLGPRGLSLLILSVCCSVLVAARRTLRFSVFFFDVLLYGGSSISPYEGSLAGP